jgi:hypothetical protein
MKASIVKNWPQYSELIDEIVNHARGVPKAVPITPATKMLSHRNQ